MLRRELWVPTELVDHSLQDSLMASPIAKATLYRTGYALADGSTA